MYVLHISITSTRIFILSRADSFRDFICSHNFGFHCMKLCQHKITEPTKWHNFFFERREKMCMKRYRQLIVSSKLELRYTILSRNRMTNVNNGNDKNWKHPIFCQPKICYWNRLIQFFSEAMRQAIHHHKHRCISNDVFFQFLITAVSFLRRAVLVYFCLYLYANHRKFVIWIFV